MTANLQENMYEVLEAIEKADRLMDGRAELGTQLRNQILDCLTTSLADSAQLKSYLRNLQSVLDRKVRYNEIVDDDALRTILESGLDTLSDAELARLALNPFALWDLCDCIRDEPTEYWHSAVSCESNDGVSEDPMHRESSASPESDQEVASRLQWTAAAGGWLHAQLGNVDSLQTAQLSAPVLSASIRLPEQDKPRFIPIGDELAKAELTHYVPWAIAIELSKSPSKSGKSRVTARVVKVNSAANTRGQIRIALLDGHGAESSVVLSAGRRNRHFDHPVPSNWDKITVHVFVTSTTDA